MRTPTGSWWMSDYYITRCHWWLESVAVLVEDTMPAGWEPAPDKALGPSVTYGWAAQPECERGAAIARRTWGQYVAVCPRLQLTFHTQSTSTLSRIKCCERYIFYKEACSFVHWNSSLLLTMFPLIFVYVLCSCMCLYNFDSPWYFLI